MDEEETEQKEVKALDKKRYRNFKNLWKGSLPQ